jgi:hypothetical protein
MFGTRYLMCCWDCNTQYSFKSGKRAKMFYDACKGNCPRCNHALHMWVPIMRYMLTPPPELKEYSVDIKTINMG